MPTQYVYFLAFTRSTSGPRGETVVRNDVLRWHKRIEDGEDIEDLERHLNERGYTPTDHVITNFILLDMVEDTDTD